MSKVALLTGINGMTSSYLSEFLLAKNYSVHGIMRRTSNPLHDNIRHILSKITIHQADMTDAGSLHKAIEESKPDEIYNMAAMSQVRWSYEVPAMTMDVNCGGFIRIVESVRALKLDCKIYQASSSEIFGKVQEVPQTERTPFYPRSPYGVSKVAAHYLARVYRESYGMKIYCGILFNHEGPRRGEEFVSRKICKYVASVAHGNKEKLKLGNLDAKRDFGYAKDYAEWIWRIVQYPTPDDFVIATGETHSIKEFVETAFKHIGVENFEDYVEYDKTLLRPAEIDLLIGDSSKSKKLLGYEIKTRFHELVKIMVDAELAKYNEPNYSFGYIK